METKTELSTGAKVWLWIIFVINIIATIANLVSGVLAFAILGIWAIIFPILSIVLVVGIALILFGKKKIGFYLMVAMAVITLICNIIAGNNIVTSIIGAILCPLITFLFIKSQWNELA